MATQSNVVELIVAMTGYAPGSTILSAAQTLIADEVLADVIAGSDVFGAIYADDAAFVADFATNLLGADYDASGLAIANQFVSDLYDDGFTPAQIAEAAVAYLKSGAVLAVFEDAAAAFANKVEVATWLATDGGEAGINMTVLASVTSDDATVTAITEAPVVVEGDEFFLTASTDVLTGTAGTDSFMAYLSQNQMIGGVSNSLSSADRLDGGAGDDSLFAELTQEFVGSNNLAVTDIQARISDIEEILFEARDYAFDNPNLVGDGSAADGLDIIVDAKHINGHDVLGSTFSDGDLTIENVTTLDADGSIRNTEELTVVMDHTDSFNTDGDASDLTVYFDEDYLLAGQTVGSSTAPFYLLDEAAVEDGVATDPLLNIERSGVRISLDGGATSISIDPSSLTDASGISDYADATTWAEYAAYLNEVLDAMRAEGTGDIDLTGLSFVHDDANTMYAAQTVQTQGGAFDVDAIVLVDTQNRDIAVTGFVQAPVEVTNFDIYGSFEGNVQAQPEDLPVTINVELEKVGRDGEGGNLTIGAKQNDFFGDSEVDQIDGIEVFNVTVRGDESKPSNLGQIISTNDELRTVNIASEARTDDSYAALTVRGETTTGVDARPFGGTLDTLNANAFMGDLVIGSGDDSRTLNIETFTATGGGDVTHWAEYDAAAKTDLIGEDDVGSFASLDSNLFTHTTGAGNDVFDADIFDGAQVRAVTGNGDDTVVAFIDGADGSGSDLSHLTVSSTGGNNTVTTTSGDADHAADITLGGGADEVNGNSVNITASTGAGDDVIYAENTGTKAAATIAADSFVTGTTDVMGISGIKGNTTVSAASLLYGQQARVTVLMPHTGDADVAAAFEDGLEVLTAEITGTNYLTTEADLYQAVADAINGDEVLNKLVEASINSLGALTVTYLIDGVATVATASDELVQIELLNSWDDLTATEQAGVIAAIRTEYENSSIDTSTAAGEVAALYNSINAVDDSDTAVDYAMLATTAGTDSTDGSDNVINAGTGDDVIVLSSDISINGALGTDAQTFVGSEDTIVFDAGVFGNDTIVHFDVSVDLGGEATTATTETAVDMLDFTDWLADQKSESGSTATTTRIDTSFEVLGGGNVDLGANTVAVVTFTDLDNATTTALTWAGLTETGILAVLNGDAGTVDFTNATENDSDANTVLDIVGTTQHSILMIENVDNLGEYLVAQVTATAGTADATDGFTNVTIVGTLDFSETQAFIAGNFA